MPARIQITSDNQILIDTGQIVALVGGACCLPDGTCQLEGSEAECLAIDPDANFKSDEVCEPNPCEEGACCLPDGSCENKTEPDCDDVEGDWWGPGTDCEDEDFECSYACCYNDMTSGMCYEATLDGCGPPYGRWAHGRHCDDLDDPCEICCGIESPLRGFASVTSYGQWDVTDTNTGSGNFCHNGGYSYFQGVMTEDCEYVRACSGSYTLSGTDCFTVTIVMYMDEFGTCDWHCVDCVVGDCGNSCVSPPSGWCEDHGCCTRTTGPGGCGHTNICNYAYDDGINTISGFEYQYEVYGGNNVCYPFFYRC